MQYRINSELSAEHILIVEDEYFIADELAKAVRTFGARVVGPAASMTEALNLLESEPITLAIVDINLGGELAYPLVDRMTELGVPVVFATGYMDDTIPRQYLHLPRWVKPYLPLTLAAALKELQ